METEFGFEEIGQKTTYKVPDGFFARVSSDTLIKARQREQFRKTNRLIWRTIVVAASLVTILYFSYFRSEPLKSGLNQIILGDHSEANQMDNPPETISNSILVAESTNLVLHKRLRIETPTVELNTVLSEMTDEELQQMAAMYKNDIFFGESPQ